MSKFSPEERALVNDLSRHFQADIDLDKVAEILASEDFSPYDIRLEMLENPNLRQQMTPEIWAAMAVRTTRDINEKIKDGGQEKTEKLLQANYVATRGCEASYGLQLIKDVNEFWRFEPTINQIFGLSRSELAKADEYAKAFSGTTHEKAIREHKESLILGYQQWDHSDLSTENINRGREMYEACVKIFERGFPNLLALKRIMDGETPKLEVLQRKSASSVRRELTEDDVESNSVYFDQILNSFDSTLRNGIVHNDIVVDPAECLVCIPTKDVSYTYERFNDIVKANFANGVFLTGTFLSLLEWHAITDSIEGRVERPEWVFGERSIPKD